MAVTRDDVARLRENDPRTPLVDADKVLPFIGADELRSNTPAEPDWIWAGYLAPGSLTLLAAKPKAGKSTLGFAVSEAVAAGAGAFLGRTVRQGPVVYVSEESSATLAHKLPRLETLRVLTREAAWPKPSWQELVAGAVQEVKRVGAVLLVVDTFAYWAALPRDAEKDAGAAQEAMQPLVDAARDVATLVPLHQRKGGGEDGEGVRGSGAIAGTADIVLELERTQQPRERVLLALSRYPTTPGSLVIHHDAATGAWAAIAEGERADARTVSDRLAILAALRDGDALTRGELEQAVGSPERQWHSTLDDLISGGDVHRDGRGVKGDPHRFSILRSVSAQPGAQQARSKDSFSAHPGRGAERNLSAQTLDERVANLTTMSDEDAEREWQRLAALHGEAA
ncbi:MAG TPA: AAA family ATPase [Solirubrobacteraceae bacterium]|jgi:hypothetical protein